MINYKKLFSIVSKSIVVFSIVFCSCKINVTPKPAENPLPSNYIYVKDFSTYVENSEETEVSVHILDKDPDLSIIRKGLDANKNKMLSIDLSECTDLIIINNKDFICCNNIKSIILPESITSIEPVAFRQCTYLESINIPSAIIKLGIETYDKFGNLADNVLSGIFEDCFSLKNVILNEGLEEIGESTFSNCNNLKSINFPSTLKKIHSYAFYNTSFESLIIPDNVECIKNNAFRQCKQLENVYIGSEVKSIDGNPFVRCYALKNIRIDEKNLFYKTIDNSIYSGDLRKLIFYNYNSTHTIPDTCEVIGKESFTDNNYLTTILLPSNLKSIEEFAFFQCLHLEDIIIPDSVVEMEPEVFDSCRSLTKVKLSAKLTYLPLGVFACCKNLEEIDIPDSVEIIYNDAFFYCEKLKNVRFHEGLKTINRSVFGYCSSLENLSLPAGLEAFSLTGLETTKIKELRIPGSVHEIRDFDLIEKIVIEEGQSNINLISVDRDSKLKEIYLPKSLNTIPDKAFEDTINLTDVYYAGSEKDWNKIDIGFFNTYLYKASIHYKVKY